MIYIVLWMCVVLTSCGWLVTHPEEMERLEEDVVDIGEILIDAVEGGLVEAQESKNAPR